MPRFTIIIMTGTAVIISSDFKYRDFVGLASGGHRACGNASRRDMVGGTEGQNPEGKLCIHSSSHIVPGQINSQTESTDFQPTHVGLSEETVSSSLLPPSSEVVFRVTDVRPCHLAVTPIAHCSEKVTSSFISGN